MRKVRVFVSYSWDSPDHKAWVRKLAEDLDSFHEIDVTWDGFDLDELSDKNQFMEHGLFSADFVLVVATRKYVQKADERKAGVGVETYLASSMHWEQLVNSHQSNLIVIQREVDCVPRYLKGKLHIDFSRDSQYSDGLNRLLQVLKGQSRIPRPPKRLSLDKSSRTYTFTKVEDVIRINHKNRRALVSGVEGADFSGANKIKFEIWETKSPTTAYFLALFNNITISQTVARAVEALKAKSVHASEITVLRPSLGDKGLVQRLFLEAGYMASIIHEYTYADYIWTYCIDDQLKQAYAPDTIPNYTDQALLVPTAEGDIRQEDSARDFFKAAFSSTPTPTAHVLIAPGGMGKTSLCLALLADLFHGEPRRASVVLIQVESLRKYLASEGFANVHIRSVYDLYEFYAKAQGDTRIYDAVTFDLAVLCGNIVVIIDGLDELISLLQERFELDSFLKSIEVLHSELGSSHFLITTRNALVISDERLRELGMMPYDLLGFDEANWMRYARRRFSRFQASGELSEKLRRQLKELRVQDEGGRVIPFFVDILATILEEDVSGPPANDFEVSYQPTPYPSNNELTDHIVHSVLRREETRQGLGISVPEVASFISELVVDFGQTIPKSEALERLQLLYDARALDLFAKISLNPLLIREQNELKLRYDFLADYFPVLFLIDSLLKDSGTPEFRRCLGRLNAPESNEFKDVFRFLSGRRDEFQRHANVIIRRLRERALDGKETMPAREEARRAISAVLRLYAAVRDLSGTQLTDQILNLFDCSRDAAGGCTLTGLCIYGDFPPMDLSSLTIVESRFVDYPRFLKCKFTNAKFMYCRFDRCGKSGIINETLSSAEFDNTCDLGDLAQTLELLNTRKDLEDAMVEAEVKKFLHCFFKSDHFVDEKTSYVKFSSRVAGLAQDKFDRLVKKGYLQVKKTKIGEVYYEVPEALRESVRRFLVNNYIDAHIRELIAFVRA